MTLHDRKPKILCVFGTRPEAIKMAPVILELSLRPDTAAVRVCVTGQHREMLDQMLALFGIHPDIDLDLMEPGQTLARLTSRTIEKVTDVLRAEHPQWVLVQGDTTTAMATALSAFYQRIVVGHIEAGLRTNDAYRPFPEEINRRVISQIATLHFAPTERAKQSLLQEGIPAKRVFLTGNTVVDALHAVLAAPASEAAKRVTSELLDTGTTPTGEIHPGRRIVLVTAHRRESFGKPLGAVCRGIRHLANDVTDAMIVFPVHMNPKVREPVDRLLGGHPRIRLLEPLSYEPFLRLMAISHLVLTDSGGVQEEASVLGIPVLILREVTERMEIVDAGLGRLVGTDERVIASEARRLLDDPTAHARMQGSKNLYGDGRSAQRIAEILGSYERNSTDGEMPKCER